MKSLILACFLLIPGIVSATEQIPDELDIDGAKFEIQALPLESHPKHEQIKQRINRPLCSASWRNYKATWSIQSEHLWLVFVQEGPCSKTSSPVADLHKLFSHDGAPVKAEWFSGKLTYRIGPTQSINKKDYKAGREYEAVVYVIEKGKVQSRAIAMLRS